MVRARHEAMEKVMRKEQEQEVQGRRRGRPKTKWKDYIAVDRTKEPGYQHDR